VSSSELLTADKLVEKIDIPSQPELLISINQEAQKERCNFDLVAEMISNDISIASEVLKTVNSPLFGLRQSVTSIQQAVGLMGLHRVIGLVRNVSLRESVSKGQNLESFWQSASKDAQACALIAQKTNIIDAEEAYTFGLFHDAGIPILMQNYSDYQSRLQDASMQSGIEATKAEDNAYKVNHAIVGYYLCDKWFLPEHICKAVYYHHRSHLVFQKAKNYDSPFIVLLALLVTSQHIIGIKSRKEDGPEYPSQWDEMQTQLQEIFKLDEEAYSSLITSTSEQLKNLD
jgi:HD-like signal output (HDOD) protein